MADGTILPLLRLCRTAPLGSDSFSACRENISNIFLRLHEKATQHHGCGYDEFFALVMGPIHKQELHLGGESAESAGVGASTCRPVITKEPDASGVDSLFLYMPSEHEQRLDLRTLYATSYLPTSSVLSKDCLLYTSPSPRDRG